MSPRTCILLLWILQIYTLCKSDNTQTGQHSDSPSIPEPVRDDHGIWKLNDDQFDRFLELHSNVAVLFTLSDDLYSYAGKYHFDRAAHILRDLRNSTTQFVVIEAGKTDKESSTIHNEFGIQQYPAIKYCHHDYLSPSINKLKSDTLSTSEWEIRCLDYNHHVVELMLVRWVEGLNNKCSFLIHDIQQFEAAKKDHPVLFIAFFESLDNVEFKLYEDICKQYKWERDLWAYQPTFAVVTNKDFANTLSENIPGLIVYCEFKEHAWIYNGPLTDRAAIRGFIEIERYPYFAQITAFNFKQYTEELDLPLIWVAIDDEYDSYVKKVGRFYEQIGIEYKGYLSIIWISSRAYMGHIRKLGFPYVPGLLYVDSKNNYKQLYDPQTSILDHDKVKKFIDSCLDGTGTLFIKSQDEKEIQEAIKKDREFLKKENILIRHVNGNELAEILESDETTYGKYNVIVFYYAPWDTRCQQFHGIYEQIAEMLLNADGTPIYNDLLLLKMDATENDTPNNINQYPKIYLYKNEIWPKTVSHENWRIYNRKREEKRFINWIKQQCGYQTVSVGVGVEGQQQSQQSDDEDEEEENEQFEYY